ncbi:MAG: UDP-N-acetylglucosamine 2-epimerase [Candidatus Delongbacteria bacterium]
MIHIFIGTKAQLIKMAPVMKEFSQKSVDYNYISTGQHKETIKDILDNFNIKGPDICLYSGKDINSVFSMVLWSVGILLKIMFNKKKIFRNDKGGIVLVHGDTLSTVLGALAGKLSGLKVGHVESGLRSFNLFQPFPEEIFRLLSFRLSDIMFCPGKAATKNLEKHKGKKINTEMNTLYDSLRYCMPGLKKITDVDIPENKYAVATLHRYENIKNETTLNKITDLLIKISKKIKIIFILHKITEKKMLEFSLLDKLRRNNNIELRPRYDYFRFIKLIENSEFVISDGGSNQEECSYLGKPVIIFRNVTERNEGIDINAVVSKLDPSIVQNFVDNYSKYRHLPFSSTNRPSEIIANYCIDNYN